MINFFRGRGLTASPPPVILQKLVLEKHQNKVSLLSNPNFMETQMEINPNHDKNVDIKEFNFHFKKDKLGNKRPSVELKLPVPSVEGIVAIIEKGGKELELLQDAIYDVIRSQAGSIVSDDEKISQTTFPVANILWSAIANMPKADRRSSAIDSAVWEAFAKDYIDVMPGVTGKSVEAVTNATVVYLKKFSIVKTNKDVIGKLKDQLGLYMEHSKNVEQFTEILELLISKADSYLAANDVELLVKNL